MKSQAYCAGWIDTYDISCGNNVCCKPVPSTMNPEPTDPSMYISSYILQQLKGSLEACFTTLCIYLKVL